MANLRIVLIEDDTQIRRFLRASLSSSDYELLEATSGAEGIGLVAQQRPDCVILDLGLPDLDGAQVLHEIRGWSQVPIIILTARGQEQEKIALLDAGADDYLTKPFGVGELMARIRVALRRNQAGAAPESALLHVGDIQLDLAKREVLRAGQQVHLTPIEYKLLVTLARYSGRVVTQRQLLEEVWGPEYTDATHYLRVYMQHLRHKLESDPARPRHLLTEPGVGYRLRTE